VGIARGVEITDTGCPFYNRCPIAMDGKCNTDIPPTLEPHPGHFISCHRTMEEIAEAEQAPQQVLHGFEKVAPEDAKVGAPG
jgi:ABC-type dipeptide/oligopeptide/nickel transport system ATPase component